MKRRSVDQVAGADRHDRERAPWRRWVPVAAFGLASAALVVLAVVMGRAHRAQAIARANRELSAVASLKVSAIAGWTEEQVRTARYAASWPFVQVLVGAGADDWVREHGRTVFQGLADRYDLQFIGVVSGDGEFLVHWPEVPPGGVPIDGTLLRAATDSPQRVATRLAVTDAHLPYLDVALALPRDGPAGLFLYLRAGAQQMIGAVVKPWSDRYGSNGAALILPGTDPLLVFRGDRESAALVEEVPPSAIGRTVVQAARGRMGETSGADEKGEPVIAVTQQVTGEPWLLQATVALSDVEHETTAAERLAEAFVVALVVGGMVLLAFWWRQDAARSRMEGRLRSSDAALRRLAAAVEQAPVSVVITDGDGVVQFVNPAFERATGRAAKEAIGQRASFVGGSALDTTRAEPARTVQAGGIWEGRLPNRRKDGSAFTEDAVIAPVKDADGAIRNWVAVSRDITSELVLQERLAESQRMESVARLAGGIAHDFNNVLTVILSCSDLLRRSIQDEHRPDPEDVEQIQDAAERARDLTRGLLAFARHQVIAPVSLDLSAFVRGSEKLLRRLLTEDIELDLALDPTLPPVRWDPTQMEQVLINLLVNARDAMPGGGRVVIRTTPAQVSEAEAARVGLPPGAYVQLSVEDSGTGMSAEVQARIFEPFFTTKEVGKGTGLGLATVHGIVHQSGGTIAVRSAPGEGTRFEILLPVSREPATSRETPPPIESGRGSETILLVEDDRDVRNVTGRMLRDAGYTVLSAGNGSEAVQAAASHAGPIDLLLTDVVMPDGNGLEVVRKVREDRPHVPVLFISGHPHEVLVSRGALEPGVDLLMKPFSPSTLLGRVRSALGRRVVTA